MRAHLLRMLVVIVAALPGCLAAGLATASAPARPPSVQILRATVDRRVHTVDLRLRSCFSAGPRAQVVITEHRSYHHRVTTHRWVPRAVEPTRISPFACRTNWRLNWLLEPQLRGPGSYGATIRVRDAYARWAPAVAFTVNSR